MKLFFSFYVVLISSVCSFAQSVKFKASYGGSGNDYGQSVRQTYDRGYIVAGSAASFGNAIDMYLIKTDSVGVMQWHKHYGGSAVDRVYSVKQTTDSGYVMVGFSNSISGNYDVCIVKTDKTGNTSWIKSYGGSNWDFGYSIQQTFDGGYIVAGTTYSFGSGNKDMYLLKLNQNGDTLWTKTFGGSNEDEGNSVIHTVQDSGYLAVGYTKSFGDSLDGDVYAVKTNKDGDTLWTKKYLKNGIGFASDVVQSTFHSCYMLVGTIDTAGRKISYTQKIDYSGNKIWDVHTGISSLVNDDQAFALAETEDHYFVLAGYTENFGAGLKDIYMYFFDQGGYFVHSTTFGYTTDDMAYSIALCKDKGFIICGETKNTLQGPLQANVFLVKTDSLGNKFGVDNSSLAGGQYTASVWEPFYSILSVEENQSFENSVYPNPFVDQVKIKLNVTSPINPGDLEFIIIDLTGKEITSSFQTVIENLQSDFILYSLRRSKEQPAGLYFFKLISKSNHAIISSVKLSIID